MAGGKKGQERTKFNQRFHILLILIFDLTHKNSKFHEVPFIIAFPQPNNISQNFDYTYLPFKFGQTSINRPLFQLKHKLVIICKINYSENPTNEFKTFWGENIQSLSYINITYIKLYWPFNICWKLGTSWYFADFDLFYEINAIMLGYVGYW